MIALRTMMSFRRSRAAAMPLNERRKRERAPQIALRRETPASNRGREAPLGWRKKAPLRFRSEPESLWSEHRDIERLYAPIDSRAANT